MKPEWMGEQPKQQYTDPLELMEDLCASFYSGKQERNKMDRFRDFRKVFYGSPEGKRVLYEILAWAGIYRPETPKVGDIDVNRVFEQIGRKKMGIDISRLLIQTDIQVPQVVIIPKSIQISGKVSHNLAPVQDARVSLAFGQSSSTTETATDGSFTTSVDIPLDLSLVGPHQLTTTIEPAEPLYAPLQIKRQVFTVNPLNIGLMLVAFFSLGLLVYNRVRAKVPSLQEEKVILQPQVREASAVPGGRSTIK